MLMRILNSLIEHTPVLAARRTVKTKWYIINRYNESHNDTMDESAVMLFLCDEQRGNLTEEQRTFAKEKKAEVHSSFSLSVFELILYQESESRDELVRETRKAMLDLSRQMSESVCGDSETERMMQNLSQQLGEVKGKKSYGYLPKPLKQQVDEIVNRMERLPVVDRCYQKWWELQCKVNDFYSEKDRQRPPLSEQKEFRAIKNAVIQEAEHIRQNQITYEDKKMEDRGGWLSQAGISLTCLELWETANSKEFPLVERDGAAAELEELAELGDVHAQFLTGALYRDGGLLIPDAEKARHWLEQAAERELPQAQYAIGKLLLSDDPDVHDPSDGIRWLNAAAQNGNDYAAYALGKEYLSGEHVHKDVDRAAEYLRQAAEAQNPWAQYLLGKLYLMGEGAEQNQEVAYGWLQAAAIQGHPYAQFVVDQMEQQERQEQHPSLGVLLSVTQLLHHMGNIFRDNVPEDSTSTGLHIDHKRLQALQEKRIALGHKPDDHVEEQTMGGMTM